MSPMCLNNNNFNKKKNPHFDFEHIVPQSSVHYANIKKKLKLSSKNRNALRRVKRNVLRKYGGTNHTLKKSNTPLKVVSNSEYTGSLYTRKHSGGSSVKSAPHVSWDNVDSLGEQLRDTSQTDMKATEGLTSIDLTQLESVVL